MGYERKLYVVSEWDRAISAEVIAEIDMSKLGTAFNGLFRRNAAKPIYLLETEEDTKVTLDKYGKHIKSEMPEKVIKALEKDYASSHYWREKVAVDLIKSVLKNNNEMFDDEKIMIYSYGY